MTREVSVTTEGTWRVPQMLYTRYLLPVYYLGRYVQILNINLRKLYSLGRGKDGSVF